ncbi:hypothetical protein HBI22_193870 [Parastagonospora nodorum]|nr:hypothetical protein HBI28_170780 [Parastagonospora nodorum]KAH5621528.1 hypothetical protein HBI22_193870 [Parastagonospora nodorum]
MFSASPAKANTTSSNSMSQTNVREGYRITTLEVIKLIEDLTSYTIMLAKVRQYSAKVKIENLSNTLTLTLSKTAQRQSSSIVSNRSTASITNKFSVASLTKPAILNNANITLVDAVHYSVVIDALTMTLIKDNDDLLGTVNSYIKLRRLRAVMLLCQTTKLLGDSNKDRPPLKRCKTKAADSRHAKASRRRTKKDKDLEDSNTSSNVLRLRRRDRAAACAQSAKRKQLEKEAQLKKTRDEEELAKAKKEKEEKEAQKRETYSSDINSEDNSEDEEATTLIDAYILYFKELSSNNSRIFANAIGIGKTRAIVLATEVQNAQAEGNATEYNAVNDDDKLCPTKGERTFYCACERSPFFNCDLSDPLALQFCFFSNSPLENIGRLTKEKAIEMRIDTTNAISKALAAANKLIILEANTPAVHPKATKHRLAPLAARFVIVCGFRKVDKHIFRAYNTISVTAQRTIIRKGSPYVEKRAILLPNFLSIVQNAKQQCRDILEKEGLNKSEASRRIIFNCFEIQAIASYPALATLKAAQFKTYSSRKVKRFTLNSIKDLFTNLSKDYFLVREARAITKSSLKF